MKKKILTLFILSSLIICACKKEKIKPKFDFLKVDQTNADGYSCLEIDMSKSGTVVALINSHHHENHTTAYITIDNGENWTATLSGDSFNGTIHSVNIVDDSYVYAIKKGAMQNSFLKYDILNGSFSETESSDNLKISPNSKISFPTEETGYLISEFDIVYKTQDYGATWDSITTGIFDEIDFITKDIGYATTHEFCMKTIDGGNTWDTVYTGNSNSINGLQFTNNDVGVLFGDNIMLTTDGGANWSEILENKVIDCSINENEEIYAITIENEIFRSINSGQDWSRKCHKYDGFRSVEVSNSLIFAGIQSSNPKDEILIGRLK